MEQHKLSMGKLAKLADVSKTTIHRILNRISIPTMKTARRLNEALGIRVEWWSQVAR